MSEHQSSSNPDASSQLPSTPDLNDPSSSASSLTPKEYTRNVSEGNSSFVARSANVKPNTPVKPYTPAKSIGFRKSAVLEHIAVSFDFEIVDEREVRADNDGRDVYTDYLAGSYEMTGDQIARLPQQTVTLTHYFKRPTTRAREKLAEVVQGSPKRRAKGARIRQATFAFWAQNITSVEGYADLKEWIEKNDDDGDFRNYFTDAIGMDHAELALTLLLQKITGEEAEVTKK